MATMAVGSFIGGYLPAFVVRLAQPSGAVLTPESGQTPAAYGATIIIGAVIVVAGLVPFWFVRTGRKPRGPKIVAETTEPTPWRQLMLFAVPMLAFGFTGGLTFPFYNLFFRTRFELPDESVGIILSIGWMGMALIPLLNPWWERRFGRARALGIILSIAATAFLLMAASPTLGLCVIAFVAAISFRNGMQPLFQPLVLDRLSPALHNNASSMSMVMWNIGWYIATLMSGFLQKNFGFGVVLTIVAVGVFITAACVVLIFQRYEPLTLKRA
jgi:predicted MFS family arabinose efflux permease